MGTIRPIRPDEVDELFAMICELAAYEKSLQHVESTAEDFRVALFGPDPQLFGHVVGAFSGSRRMRISPADVLRITTGRGLGIVAAVSLRSRPG